MSDRLTKDKTEYERLIAFRSAAIADGWENRPHGQLFKEGYLMDIHAEESDDWFLSGAEIYIWGPDGLALKNYPKEYDWEAIKQRARECHFCGTDTGHMQRVCFANKSCDKCYPAAIKRLEVPGWDD
jgi:hypothetical protein